MKIGMTIGVIIRNDQRNDRNEDSNTKDINSKKDRIGDAIDVSRPSIIESPILSFLLLISFVLLFKLAVSIYMVCVTLKN